MNSKQRYDEAFKKHAVELLECGNRTMRQLAQELGVPYKTLEKWKARYRTLHRVESGSLSGGSEVEQLRRKLAYVERERDILKKALAICSRDPDTKSGLN